VLAIGGAAYRARRLAAERGRHASRPEPKAEETLRAIHGDRRRSPSATVVSGDPSTDQTAGRGWIGHRQVPHTRTAWNPASRTQVNILNDEIAFYPMLYWPVLASAKPLPDATLAKIDAYMKQGGMIIFDTKDYGQGIPTGFTMRGEGTPLQRLLGNLDIPRLEPCLSSMCLPSRSTC
jgi:hypothetical protein